MEHFNKSRPNNKAYNKQLTNFDFGKKTQHLVCSIRF